VSKQPELSTDTRSGRRQGGLSWRLGVYGGALVDTHRLLLAVAVSLAFVIARACVGWLGRIRVVRSLGLALIVGPLSGGLIVASLALQSYAVGWA
jgi:hypothetical protein